MRKNKLLLIAAVVATTAMAAKASDGVLLRLRGGGTVGFAMAERPVLELNASDLTMRYGASSEVTYPYDDVQRVEWGELPVPTGINTATTGKSQVVFAMQGATLQVAGMNDGETATLWNASGQQLATATSRNGQAALPLARLQGVGIVRTSTGVSFKLIKK